MRGGESKSETMKENGGDAGIAANEKERQSEMWKRRGQGNKRERECKDEKISKRKCKDKKNDIM